ncbi:MAG: glutathione S-transferase family protein [Steroidobacteraceae bacterium]
MALELYLHPLSSYCHKALIALYENATPFTMKRVDDPAVSHELKALWPIGRFPVLRDTSRGVEEARTLYRTALDLFEADLAGHTCAVGDELTLADCAAAPTLFYGNRFYGPFRATHPRAMAYLDRMMARPSYARALAEAEPYMHLLPK